MPTDILGLGTVVYHVKDLDAAKNWYAKAFRQNPYFDQPFYVGFQLGGFELGLDPDPAPYSAGASSVAFWRTNDVRETFRRFVAEGAQPRQEPTGVGDGIAIATVNDPFGNVIGFIENPGFKALS